jgi:hypothetical protein
MPKTSSTAPKLVREMAESMWHSLQARGALYQTDAVRMLQAKQGGKRLLYKNKNNNWALDRRVLAAFRVAHAGRAIWDRDAYCWELKNAE